MKKEYCKLNKKSYSDMDYILYFPKKVEENMSLLLFLHGMGERGRNIKDIEKCSLPKYLNEIDIPYIVIAPQCDNNNFWDYYIRDIEKILEEVYSKYKYDKNKVCIIGSSMGSFGAWNYIMSRPNLFKGIISVSGGVMIKIETTMIPIKDKAILMYHGNKDNLISVNESVKVYNKLKSLGASNIELKIIENETHSLTNNAFKDKYIYEWLNKNIREN